MTTTTKKAAEKKPNTNVKVGYNSKKHVVDVQFDVSKFVKREELELSTSGKSYMVASTHGAKEFEATDLQGLYYSVNVYASKKQYDEHMEFLRNKATAKEVMKEQEAAALPAGLDKLLSMDADKLEKLLKLAAVL
jgi:hypothetical protein